MTPVGFVPCLPENAPFTPEQRAYLNGFLAGLFSHAPVPNTGGPAQEARTLRPLSVLFGSQTGNAENLAKRIAKEAGQRGFAPTVYDLAKYPAMQLACEKHLLIVTSTYGDGEPPDNAKAFWEFLSSDGMPRLPQVRFSVCALGDTNYPRFCAFGKSVDARLQALGARRIHPRADCDVEYEAAFEGWVREALTTLLECGDLSPLSADDLSPSQLPYPAIEEPVLSALAPGDGATRQESADKSEHSKACDRANPFPASLTTNRKLNAPGSSKDVRHFEFSLEGSNLIYEVGDALGVWPMNCQNLVADILAALRCHGEEAVPGRTGQATTFRDALLNSYEITKIPHAFLQTVAEKSGDESLRKLAAPGTNGELTKFLWGREIIDLLLAHPEARFSATEFIGLLKKLQPRLYSISSSPKAHPKQVHLTVSVLRYESLGRARKGVCSTFLAERSGSDPTVPVFAHRNIAFRPPTADAPLIMVGPGTGIAPFRAFLEERRAIGATGRNWLFFGDQHSATDFLYRDEIESMRCDGLLTRLDVAWSRDQAGKAYVQHRMVECARDLYGWLEEGAGFYVCGDASRMAKDVDLALHEVIRKGGSKTSDQAAEYVSRLKAEKRYCRDVY